MKKIYFIPYNDMEGFYASCQPAVHLLYPNVVVVPSDLSKPILQKEVAVMSCSDDGSVVNTIFFENLLCSANMYAYEQKKETVVVVTDHTIFIPLSELANELKGSGIKKLRYFPRDEVVFCPYDKNTTNRLYGFYIDDSSGIDRVLLEPVEIQDARWIEKEKDPLLLN